METKEEYIKRKLALYNAVKEKYLTNDEKFGVWDEQKEYFYKKDIDKMKTLSDEEYRKILDDDEKRKQNNLIMIEKDKIFDSKLKEFGLTDEQIFDLSYDEISNILTEEQLNEFEKLVVDY